MQVCPEILPNCSTKYSKPRKPGSSLCVIQPENQRNISPPDNVSTRKGMETHASRNATGQTSLQKVAIPMKKAHPA